MKYIYGVETADYEWTVYRFAVADYAQAVRWMLRARITGTIRWLCDFNTARAMAGEQATQPKAWTNKDARNLAVRG